MSIATNHPSARPDARKTEAVLLAVLLVLAGGIAPARSAEATPRQAQGAARIDCTCRANGHSYHLGERVCLSTPQGFRVAECRMSQNVTSWAVGSEDCVVSAVTPAPWPAGGRS
jgi:hypothetical protein